MKHCFAKAPQYEASPFHSDMKHFHLRPSCPFACFALCFSTFFDVCDAQAQQLTLLWKHEVAAFRILQDYVTKFRESIKNDKLGQGFIKSGLYSVRKTTILEKENIVDISVPQWLLNSMCAIWNSGIKVIYAKDRMGDDNYPNAYWHGMNSCVISEYLPKLVNE